MSLTTKEIEKIARLARIRINAAEAEQYVSELNKIMSFVEQLNQVPTDNVKPLASVHDSNTPWRDDVVNDGNIAEAITANAPEATEGFFVVPKVVE